MDLNSISTGVSLSRNDSEKSIEHNDHAPLFSEKNQKQATDLQKSIRSGENVLDNMQALRALANPDAQSSITIDYDGQNFSCKIGGEVISTLDMAAASEQLNDSNISTFSNPLQAFSQIKAGGKPSQIADLACTLSKDSTTLELTRGNHSLLQLSLDKVNKTDWKAAHTAFTDLPSSKPSGIKAVPVNQSLLIALPPASSMQGVELADLLPEQLSTKMLPNESRYLFNIVGMIKDGVVGANKSKEFKTLDSLTGQLNKQLATLPDTFANLKAASATLDTSASKMEASITKAEEALNAAQEALANLQAECGNVAIQERAETKDLHGRIQHIKVQLDALQTQLDTLKSTETADGARHDWRTQIDTVGQEIAQKTPSLKNISTEDKLWLAQLKNVLGDNKLPTPDELTKALSKLMQNGIALPKLDTTLALLGAFYPGQAKAKTDGASLPTVNSLDKQPEIQQKYQKLQGDRATVLQQREDKLLFVRMLDTACKTAQETLKGELDASKQNTVSATAECNVRVGQLERFLRMSWRDGSKSASEHAEKALTGLQASIDISGLDDLAIIGGDQNSDAALRMFARTEMETITRGRLQFEDAENLEDLDISPETLEAYQALDPQVKSQLQLLARECMQLGFTTNYEQNHQLEHFNFSDAVADGQLLKNFKLHPDESLAYLHQRENALQNHQAKLEQLATLVKSLPDETMSAIAGTLAKEQAAIATEREMIVSVLDAAAALTDVDRLDKANTLQKQESAKLATRLTDTATPFAGELARINLEAYQLRSQALKANIADIGELARQRNALQPELDEIAQNIFDAFNQGQAGDLQAIIKANPGDHRVIAWQERHAETQEIGKEIDVLNAQFKLELLALQVEEKRAQSAEGGGYPKDTNWTSWLVAKMGDNAAYYYGEEKVKPRDLLLLQQLALSGKTMAEAQKDMAASMLKLATEPQQALTELGLTPSQLTTWYAAYPEQLQQLSTNLNHVYNALQTSGGSAVNDLLRTAWNRGTTESVLEDALFGRREALVGITDAQPMPPALIALLSAAEWAPYATQAARGALQQNAGGQAAAIIASLATGGAGGVAIGVGTAVLGAFLGAAQAQVERGIADEVVKHRNINVAVNGVLRAMSLGPEADINTRIKEFASSTMQREALRVVGTSGRDIAIHGKLGAVQQAVKELRLTWNGASTLQKAALVGATATASIVAGGLIALSLATPVGWVAAGVIGLFMMAGMAMGVTTFGWPALSEWFMPGLAAEVKKELNNEVLDNALKRAQQTLKDTIATQKLSIKPGVNITPEDLQASTGTALQAKVDGIISQLKADPDFANWSPEDVAKEFNIAFKSIKVAAPELHLNSTAPELAGVNPEDIKTVSEKVVASLTTAVRIQTDDAPKLVTT